MTDSSNVVRLFFDEADLEQAWERFDAAMLRLHDLYGHDSDENDRRRAAVEAANAEVEFRQIFARTSAPRLLARA